MAWEIEHTTTDAENSRFVDSLQLNLLFSESAVVLSGYNHHYNRFGTQQIC